MTTSAQSSKRLRGFTLIELLVVVGIIGLLMALVIPAFTGIGRGQTMKSSVAQLRTTAALARQWAITRRENTFILFADHTLNYTSTNNSMAWRAYAVWGENSGYIREWTHLPVGVVFNPYTNRARFYSGEFNFTNLMTLGTAKTTNMVIHDEFTAWRVPFPDSNSPTQWVYALGFTPDGRNANSDYVQYSIYVSEGWVTNTTTAAYPPEIRPQRMTMGLECRPLTGQMRIREF